MEHGAVLLAALVWGGRLPGSVCRPSFASVVASVFAPAFASVVANSTPANDDTTRIARLGAERQSPSIEIAALEEGDRNVVYVIPRVLQAGVQGRQIRML